MVFARQKRGRGPLSGLVTSGMPSLPSVLQELAWAPGRRVAVVGRARAPPYYAIGLGIPIVGVGSPPTTMDRGFRE